MTYAELYLRLRELTVEQLGMTVTIGFEDNEFFEANFKIINDSDVLDEGHPIIVANLEMTLE